jgi:hypothetical protein
MSLIFPKFSNLNLNIKRFNFGFGSTDNAFITVKTANQLIDHINILASNAGVNTSFFFKVLDTGGIPSSMISVAGGTCTCAGCPPNSTGTNCGGCTGVNTSSFYTCAAASASVNRVSPGIYNVTFVANAATDYTNAVLKISNLDITYSKSIVTLAKTSGPTGLTWTIHTYNTLTGTLEYNLDNAIVELVLMK